jgi:hypothetical protein
MSSQEQRNEDGNVIGCGDGAISILSRNNVGWKNSW